MTSSGQRLFPLDKFGLGRQGGGRYFRFSQQSKSEQQDGAYSYKFVWWDVTCLLLPTVNIQCNFTDNIV